MIGENQAIIGLFGRREAVNQTIIAAVYNYVRYLFAFKVLAISSTIKGVFLFMFSPSKCTVVYAFSTNMFFSINDVSSQP